MSQPFFFLAKCWEVWYFGTARHFFVRWICLDHGDTNTRANSFFSITHHRKSNRPGHDGGRNTRNSTTNRILAERDSVFRVLSPARHHFLVDCWVWQVSWLFSLFFVLSAFLFQRGGGGFECFDGLVFFWACFLNKIFFHYFFSNSMAWKWTFSECACFQG